MVDHRNARRTWSGSDDGNRMGRGGSAPHRAGGRRIHALPIAAALAVVLTACNGTGASPARGVVSGVVADSAATDGLVSLKDASAAPKEVEAKIDASGSFAVDVNGLTPPFLLKTDTTGAASTSLYALSSGGAVNINPISDAVVAGAGGGIDPSALYAAPAADALRSAQARAGTISAELTTALAPLLQKYGVTDPVGDTSPQGAQAMRALLADVTIQVSGGQVVVTNQQTSAVIYDGPSAAPSTGTFQAANLPANPAAATTTTPTPPAACTYSYSTWGTCQADGTQTRTLTSALPIGCTGTPVLIQSCTAPAPPPAACTYTYSAWGACQTNGTQTRTIAAASPSGCVGTPVLTQSCTPPTPPPTTTPPPSGVPSSLVAFPGAEGGGAQSVGGRGGVVMLVTNLNNSGTGSLRACMEGSGPRTCVFTVGGTITVTGSPITISQPYLTVAGQTAPGGGVQLRGDGSAFGNGIITSSSSVHDVIIRYIKIRSGPQGDPTSPSAPGPTTPAGFSIWGGYNWIIDHVTDEWDSNKSISAGYGLNHFTLSWNLFAEGELGHSTGFLAMNSTSAQADAMLVNDAHHNMFATFDHRLPMYQGKELRWVNNYVFNYTFAGLSDGGINLDVLSSVWKTGNMWTDPARKEWRWEQVGESGNATPSSLVPSIYMANNFGPDNVSGAAADFTSMTCDITNSPPNENGQCITALSTSYARSSPLSALAVPITRTTLAGQTDLLDLLQDEVGASKQVACDGTWVAARDAVDACIVGYVVNPAISPSAPPNGPYFSTCKAPTADGWPVLASGSPCADSDGDGLPDAFEDRLMPGCKNNPSGDCGPNGTIACGNGWTNLECYVNGMK